jgi:uncharacterized protein
MLKQEIIKQAAAIAKKRLGDESSGHDFSHCQRVERLALRIGKALKADLFVLSLAALLHDIDVKRGRTNHHLRSAQVAGKILQKFGVDQKTIAKVQIAIRAHSYRGSQTNPASTLEAKIISDADKLDVMGAIGVARIFAFSGHFKRPLYDPATKPNPKTYNQDGSKTAINAFYDKVFLLDKFLYTRQAKDIGKQRLAFARRFVERFKDEWEGKR